MGKASRFQGTLAVGEDAVACEQSYAVDKGVVSWDFRLTAFRDVVVGDVYVDLRVDRWLLLDDGWLAVDEERLPVPRHPWRSPSLLFRPSGGKSAAWYTKAGTGLQIARGDGLPFLSVGVDDLRAADPNAFHVRVLLGLEVNVTLTAGTTRVYSLQLSPTAILTPRLTLTEPVAGQFCTSSVQVVAQAERLPGCARLELRLDGAQVGDMPGEGGRTRVDLTGLRPGDHRFEVVAVDDKGMGLLRCERAISVADPGRCLVLQSPGLRLTLDPETGSMELRERTTGAVWPFSPEVGLFQIQEPSGALRTYTLREALRGPVARPVGGDTIRMAVQFGEYAPGVVPVRGFADVRMASDADRLEFSVEPVGASPSRLVRFAFPWRSLWVGSGSSDYLIVPHREGALILPDCRDVEEVFDGYENRTLRMLFVGARREGRAFCAHTDSLYFRPRYERIEGRLSWSMEFGSPAVPCMGRDASGKVVCEFIPSGTYVDVAHQYRRAAQARGLFVPLRDRVRQNPEVENLVGCAYYRPLFYRYKVSRSAGGLYQTFDDVERKLRRLHAEGLDRLLVILTGWETRGYDNLRPDIWPPCPEAGGTEGLRALIGAATAMGVPIGLHDNYGDMYADAPSFDLAHACVTAAGSPLQLGPWDGGMATIVCSRAQRAFAERNLKVIFAEVAPTAYYLDGLGAAPLYECHSEEHPTDRSTERDAKLAVLRSAARRCRLVGTETGAEWVLPWVSFIDDAGTRGGVNTRQFAGEVGFTNWWFGDWVSVPLFPLVYHGSIVSFQYQPQAYRPDRVGRLAFLEDLRAGRAPLYRDISMDRSSSATDASTSEDYDLYVRATYTTGVPWARETASSTVANHEFVTPDFLVERTVFSEGQVAIVNRGRENWSGDGLTLPPTGFYLRSARFLAALAERIPGNAFDRPTWVVVESRDGRPVESSRDLVVWRHEGATRLDLRTDHEVCHTSSGLILRASPAGIITVPLAHWNRLQLGPSSSEPRGAKPGR